MATESIKPLETQLAGLGVSQGVALGTALCLERADGNVFQTHLKSAVQVKLEISRFHDAIATAREQLHAIKARIETALGSHHAYIIDAHLLMLEDESLVREIETIIARERVNSEWAIKVVASRLLRAYGSIKDDYLRERGRDIDDVMHRLIRVLSGQRAVSLAQHGQNIILIADDIPPSFAAELDFKQVVGLATDVGGWTSHTAIIARGLGLPAVVGLHDAYQRAATGDTVILDGTVGQLIINPSLATIHHYEKRRREEKRSSSRWRRHSQEPARTLDGQTLTLRANLEVTTDLDAVQRFGATSIGLFRSEFLLLQNNGLIPDEARQFTEYRRIVESVKGAEATIRAFDLGTERLLAKDHDREPNPALGLRGIRFLLREPEIFRAQLRAVLRASHYGRLRLMLPMIAEVTELRAARQLLAEIKEQLRAERLPFDDRLPVGVMIEVPAAVLSADRLAQEADFLSLGTNDLVQYLLAVDRTNENVAGLYQPHHPAVLQAIKLIVAAATRAAIPLEICGEMATNPMYAALLMGLGLRSFSLTPSAIPVIKKLVRSINLQNLTALTDELYEKCATAQEVEQYLLRELPQRFPQFFTDWLG